MLMHPAPRSVRLAVHISLVLACTLLLFPTAALTEAGQSRASVDNSLPSGLVVVIENRPQQNRALDLRALTNPFISGVALQIRWRDIEPVQGKPDWSKLDQLFAAAESSKNMGTAPHLPRLFAPAWALEGAKTEQFAIQYGPGRGTVERLPMPWDGVYLTHWFAFLKQLSDRYGKSPSFSAHVPGLNPPAFSRSAFSRSGRWDVSITWALWARSRARAVGTLVVSWRRDFQSRQESTGFSR
jgi:hypothetical protein